MPTAEPVAAVPGPTDAALIAAWQGGDEQAAAELVRRHARALARFLAGAGAPEADLDDVVQETFIRAFRAVGTFRGQCRFRTWLRTSDAAIQPLRRASASVAAARRRLTSPRAATRLLRRDRKS